MAVAAAGRSHPRHIRGRRRGMPKECSIRIVECSWSLDAPSEYTPAGTSSSRSSLHRCGSSARFPSSSRRMTGLASPSCRRVRDEYRACDGLGSGGECSHHADGSLVHGASHDEHTYVRRG